MSSRILLRRFSDFLNRSVRSRAPLQRVLQQFRLKGWHTYVFGGTIRDLALTGISAVPRDVDLVVYNCTAAEIEVEFQDYVQRLTRFGGLNLAIDGWKIDVWPLQETWAFRQGLVHHASFSQLPRTTFLNVEAVAVELDGETGYPRGFYQAGFVDSIQRRVLEVNLEENPFPLLCVVRSLVMAKKLEFGISPHLARYIYQHSRSYRVDDLVAVQWDHYGSARMEKGEVGKSLECIYRAAELELNMPINLPSLERPKSEQLAFKWAG